MAGMGSWIIQGSVGGGFLMPIFPEDVAFDPQVGNRYILRFPVSPEDSSASAGVEEARIREADGLTWKDTGEIAAGLEELLEPGGRALVVPAANQRAVTALGVSAGIREMQASLADAGITVSAFETPADALAFSRKRPLGLLLVTPEEFSSGEWRKLWEESGVPTVVLPAAAAAGLEASDLAAIAAAARAHGGILRINDLTRAGVEEQGSFVVLHMV